MKKSVWVKQTYEPVDIALEACLDPEHSWRCVPLLNQHLGTDAAQKWGHYMESWLGDPPWTDCLRAFLLDCKGILIHSEPKEGYLWVCISISWALLRSWDRSKTDRFLDPGQIAGVSCEVWQATGKSDLSEMSWGHQRHGADSNQGRADGCLPIMGPDIHHPMPVEGIVCGQQAKARPEGLEYQPKNERGGQITDAGDRNPVTKVQVQGRALQTPRITCWLPINKVGL